jgi:capsular exopolysaccharide synthesis family protein
MVADDPRAQPHALSVLWQRRGLIGTIVAGSTAMAVVGLQFIPPRYSGEALIALNTRTSSTEQVLTTKQSVAAPPLTAVLVSTEKNIIESRNMGNQVVDALALDRDPEFNTRLKPSSFPPVLVEAWHGIRNALRGAAPEKDAHTQTVDEVMERLALKNDADSYVIRLDFESKDPRKAALIANAFADLYIRTQREAKLQEAQVATDWITRQISALRQELARDSSQTVALRKKNGLAPVDAREKGMVAAQGLISLNTELATVERERAEAESALTQAKHQLAIGGGNMVSLTFVDDSPFLQEMRKEEAKVLARIAELSAGYREDSPALAPLREQLATLRHEIDREITKQVEMLANKAAQAKAREDVLHARARQINSASTTSDSAMAEIEQREREIQAKNVMLDSFTARYAELTNRVEIDEPDARIASRASPPTKPSFPKPFLFIGVAFAGSLGLSASLAFLLERLRAGFQGTRQIKEDLGLPTLGIIPDVARGPSRTSAADHLVDKPDSVYAEAVRSAQLAIMSARHSGGAPGESKAILITSSLPNEGKTALAVSLGRSLALAERKVLLLDFDLRRPSVARQLNGYDVPGIADYLRQQATQEEIIRTDPRSGLDYIASGGRTGDPHRLLQDPRTNELLSRMLATYEVVLIDTPPILVASDAALLAAITDFAVYVVEWDHTPRRAVEAGLEHLASFDITTGGIVLSKVDLARQSQYGDYVDFCFRSSEYYGK